MATTIPALVETSDPPLATDSDAQFDAKAFPWAASLNPFGQSVSAIAIAARDNAEEALAAALGGDLPPLTGEALKFLRVKADESGAEFAEIPEQSTATWETGTSTTEGIVSPAKVKAAVEANSSVPDTAGSVGTYVFASIDDTTDVSFGSTIAGSKLKPHSIYITASYASADAPFSTEPASSALSGTWRCMTEAVYTDRFKMGLWLRIS